MSLSAKGKDVDHLKPVQGEEIEDEYIHNRSEERLFQVRGTGWISLCKIQLSFIITGPYHGCW